MKELEAFWQRFNVAPLFNLSDLQTHLLPPELPAADLGVTAVVDSPSSQASRPVDGQQTFTRKRPGPDRSPKRIKIQNYIGEHKDELFPLLYEPRTAKRPKTRKEATDRIRTALDIPKDTMVLKVLREDYPYKKRGEGRPVT